MFRQSFEQVIVTNNPTLLASGTTENLGVEQIGIFDASTNQAVTLPTYSTNRALYLAQGTPDFSDFPAGAGKVNETLKSKGTIKGTKITGWRGKKAKRGQTSQVAVGYDGVDTTKTLSAKPGEVKNFFIKLTGSPIEKLVHGAGGWVTHIQVSMPCADECAPNCESVDCNVIIDRFKAEFDKQKLPGGILLNKFVRLSPLIECVTPPVITEVPFCVFCITVPDAGDNQALGLIQAAYPDLTITRTKREGILSTYSATAERVGETCADDLPADYVDEGSVVIPNCTDCPEGYTYQAELYVYTVTRTDAGNAAALATARVDYGATAFRLNYQFGTSTYQVYSASATLAPVTAGDVVTSQGIQRDVCVKDETSGSGSGSGAASPCNTFTWEVCGEGVKAETTYTITLKDTVCGTSRLAELEAIYGTDVAQIDNNPDTCTRIYSVPVLSDNVDITGDCEPEFFTFTAPQPFEGVKWTKVPLDTGEDCACGFLLEAGFVNRTLTECYFDAFPYEFDNIHIEVATGDPNFQNYKDLCDSDLPVTVVREFEYPAGSGEYLAKRESLSREYDQLEGRPVDQFVRNARKWTFNTDLSKFYDQYVLEYEVEYFVGGFTEKYTDRYHLHVHFPEGTGTQFQNAINAYVTSAKIDLPLVIL